MRALFLTISLTLAATVANAATAGKATVKKSTKVETTAERPFDFNTASFKEILDRYVFIADFNQKSPERPVSDEFFWKYPFKLPPVSFELDVDHYDLNSLVYQVKGSGRRTAVINDGRAAFLEGDHEKAHKIWLDARQDYKDDVVFNKMFEFFLGVNAMEAYRKLVSQPKVTPDQAEIDKLLKRVVYFFASVFILRRDVSEPRIDPVAPWALYNIAVIYYRFERFPSLFGASQEGLAALLRDGKSLHRSELRQLAAEAYIKNQDLMSAIQELDTAIRQDPDQKQAARMFSRAGDIYYGLNNYELADDMYAMANAIDRERKVYNAAQSVLRGETAFWLGRFGDAEKAFRFAIDTAMRTQGHDWLHDSQTLAWAYLRVADALLARAAVAKNNVRKDLLEQSRLAYFAVQSNYPRHEAARIAEVRRACMEMPSYQGNNIRHGRDVLTAAKENKDLPERLMELVWACYAGSYSDRERTDEMVSKIQEFSDKYPRSRFLPAMIPPVREVQASKIDEHFQKQQWENAAEFFEQRRATLFPEISSELARNLWTAYVSTSQSEKAIEFWRKDFGPISSDLDALRRVTFLHEAASMKDGRKLVQPRNAMNKELASRTWTSKPTKEFADYLLRVLAAKDVAGAYPWILNLQDVWTKGDDEASCSVLFPLLSRIHDDRQSAKDVRLEVKRRIMGFPASNLAGLREKDPGCFQSWIDLEAKVLSPAELEVAYEARGDWPLAGAWLERAWGFAEEANARGNTALAIKLWTKIAEKAPADSFEARMAKTRLDPTRTEYESLWR